MTINLLIIFIVCNILNVIFNTVKSICTIKGSKLVASLANAITYGFYTYIIILTTCELPLLAKCLIVGACNFIGVYIVKLLEEKARKDKLWRIEFTVKDNFKDVREALLDSNMQFFYNIVGRHTVFTVFCAKKQDTDKVTNIIKQYNGKYFITENIADI